MGWLLFNYKPWFKREGLPNHWQSLFKKTLGITQQHSCKMPVFFPPMCYSWYFWNDCYGGFLAMKSSATTPFYCLKFASFCGRHSFLCIVAVCWWKNEAYTDWYYGILLLSIIINNVTFETDDFIFAKMERITKLLAPFLPFNNSCLFLLLERNLWHFAIFVTKSSHITVKFSLLSAIPD